MTKTAFIVTLSSCLLPSTLLSNGPWPKERHFYPDRPGSFQTLRLVHYKHIYSPFLFSLPLDNDDGKRNEMPSDSVIPCAVLDASSLWYTGQTQGREPCFFSSTRGEHGISKGQKEDLNTALFRPFLFSFFCFFLHLFCAHFTPDQHLHNSTFHTLYTIVYTILFCTLIARFATYNTFCIQKHP